MDVLEKYRKIRRRLEFTAGMIAFIAGDIISSCLGVFGKKFFSWDTALSLVIVAALAIVLNSIAIGIADKWYEKNKNEND